MSSLRIAVIRRYANLVRPLPAISAGLETRRTYAKVKARSHSKSPSPSPASDLLVPKSQQILSDPASLQLYVQVEAKMKKSVDWYRKECASLEARASGRVTPSMLDPVRVELEGGENVRLDSIATIGVRDGSTFWITAYDGSVRIFLRSYGSVNLVSMLQ
jgi:ribosome recycling factor